MRKLTYSELHNDLEKNKTAKVDKYIKVKPEDFISFPSKPKNLTPYITIMRLSQTLFIFQT